MKGTKFVNGIRRNSGLEWSIKMEKLLALEELLLVTDTKFSKGGQGRDVVHTTFTA